MSPHPRPSTTRQKVAPIRRALGVRTAFNIVGPLLNAAGAQHVVVGVFHEVGRTPLNPKIPQTPDPRAHDPESVHQTLTRECWTARVALRLSIRDPDATRWQGLMDLLASTLMEMGNVEVGQPRLHIPA